MDRQHAVRESYKWQKNNLKLRSWVKKLKAQLDEIGLTYVWQAHGQNNVIRACKTITRNM
jgi:hypothetical protein